MVMPRTETLVQLNDRLLALLDERAARDGTSRSELIRSAIEEYVAQDADAAIDAALVAGYRRVPADEPGDPVCALAIASIDEEPW